MLCAAFVSVLLVLRTEFLRCHIAVGFERFVECGFIRVFHKNTYFGYFLVRIAQKEFGAVDARLLLFLAEVHSVKLE